jgi:hypothetical protein
MHIDMPDLSNATPSSSYGHCLRPTLLCSCFHPLLPPPPFFFPHTATQSSSDKRALIFWEDIEASPQIALGPWAVFKRGYATVEEGLTMRGQFINYDLMFQWHRYKAMEKLNKHIVGANITSYTDTATQAHATSIIQVDEDMARLVKQPVGSNVSFWELRRVVASRFHLTMPSFS